MATGDARDIRINPGLIIKDPTDLGSPDTDYGGTVLGLYRDVVFRPESTHYEVIAEEFGSEVVESIKGGSRPVLAAFLRSYDNDALSTIFPSTAAGSSSGDRVITYPGSNGPGHKRSTESFKLLLAPEDRLTDPALILYNALPMIDDAAEILFHTEEEYGFPVMFRGIRNSSGNVFQIGKVEDLSLT